MARELGVSVSQPDGVDGLEGMMGRR